MPFRIVRNDLTKMQVDAIVNTANPRPGIGGGTDRAVYEAAGRDVLLAERKKIGKIARGQAAVTPAFGLQAKYIIHTVGPRWYDGRKREADTLRSCYENSLRLAKEKGCGSIAFPLISTGVYGFPKELALQIVIGTVSRFLTQEDMMIYLVVFDRKATRLSEKLFEKIDARIDDAYVREKRKEEYWEDREEMSSVSCEALTDRDRWQNVFRRNRPEERSGDWLEERSGDRPEERSGYWTDAAPAPAARMTEPSARSLKALMEQRDETFQQMLLRMIAERGMTNAQAYKKANQDKKLFSKIKNDINYQPKKKTAMAFALALELTLDEAKDLLARAGYAFSPSNDFDKVIRYCIETREYDIYEIEIILYELGLDTLCNY